MSAEPDRTPRKEKVNLKYVILLEAFTTFSKTIYWLLHSDASGAEHKPVCSHNATSEPSTNILTFP